MRRVGGAVLALVIGCGGGSSHDRVERSQTYVLEKGSEPRYMLRYAVPAGAKQSLDLVLDITMSASGAGIPETRLPRMVMVEDVDATAADPKKGTDLAMTISDVRLEDRPGATTVPGATAAFEEIRGLRMTGRLAPNGITQDLRVDESSVAPAVRDQLNQTEQMVDEMTTILPDVPLGKGARWRVEETVRQGEIKMEIETSYEILAVSEHGATIHADLTESAPEQTVHEGGLALTLEDLSGTGTIDSELDFTKLVDHVKGTTSMDMSMSGGGQHVDLSMQMGLEILPDGERPAPPPPADDDAPER